MSTLSTSSISITPIDSIREKALRNELLSSAEIKYIIDQSTPLSDVLNAAHAVRLHFHDTQVSLCAIVNAKSGLCSENCAFCAQSRFHSANPPEHPLLSAEEIGKAAARAKAAGATRFGVVASGKLVGDSDFEGFKQAVAKVIEQGLEPDLSPGILSTEQLIELREIGLTGYHHNLETAASFFPNICTTHKYEEDVEAVRRGLEAGFMVCSGGIFGIGESWEQRVELALLLRELGVPSVPINFLHPIAGTPLEKQEVLSPEEALRIVALYRLILPKAALRICGGRATVFGNKRKKELLMSGASGVMVGDYLTTAGSEAESDREEIMDAGLRYL